MDILTFKASNARKLTLTLVSLGFALLFYGISQMVPAGGLQRAFIIIPLIAAITNIAALWLTRLVISTQRIAYRGLWQRWSVPLPEIESWKVIKNPGGPNASLRLKTLSGKSFEVADLSVLSIGNPDQLGSALAARIRQAR
jgi:hypothetical protein